MAFTEQVQAIIEQALRDAALDPDGIGEKVRDELDQLGITATLASVTAGVSPPAVSSLPVAPVDGQVIDYIADAALGVVWRLRYRLASASALKWEFVGGSELRATTDADEATAVAHNVYQALATGVSVTVPLLGDYRVDEWCNAYSATAAENPFVSVKVGGAAAADVDSGSAVLGAVNTGANIYARRHVLAVPALTVLAQQYRAGNNNQTHFRTRGMGVRPIRVG